MKNVLIISSSPRANGNSETLCRQFMKGATEAGHACEMICLRNLSLSPCAACDTCKRGSEICAIKDDADGVLEKMIAADVIVLATPVYFFTLSAQLKTLIDRTRPKYRRMKNKEFYFIATVGAKGRGLMDYTFDPLRGFLACLGDPIERGAIYADGAWLPGDVKAHPAYDKAYEMGKQI